MRIAFTGTSSTGKTTLAKRLVGHGMLESHVSKFISANARTIMDEHGWKSIDEMTANDRCCMQWAYLDKKLTTEKSSAAFVTDRSFIDVAAYWLEYDCRDSECGTQVQFIEQCRVAAFTYDITFYFPSGLIPFDADGYRSKDPEMHLRIDKKIRDLASTWGIPLVPVQSADIDARVSEVATAISGW